MKGFVIAIDGPVAAGKSTMATELTRELGGFYLWTGAMYRCVALFCMEHGIDITDNKKIINSLSQIHIIINKQQIVLNGIDVTQRIKEEKYAGPTSVLSAIPEVRVTMVALQKKLALEKMNEGQIVISEGRDQGTVVFPDAALKIFLTASQEVRAKRRLAQTAARGSVDFKQVLNEIRERDERDMTRKASPLASEPKHFGYFVIDDTDQTKEKTIEIVIKELKRRNLFI